MPGKHERELMEEIRSLKSELARLQRSQDSTSRNQQPVKQILNDGGERIEEALRESEHRLILAQRIAKVGDFTWDVETGEVTWSDGLYDLLRYDKSELVDYSKVNAEIHHPADLERVTEWLNDCIESGSGELRPNDYRLIRKDGETIFVHTVGIIERDMGRVKIFATLQDITKRRQAEEALRKTNEEMRAILDVSPDIIHVLDIDGIILSANKSYAARIGLEMDDVVGQNIFDYCPAEAVHLRKAAMDEVFRTGQSLHIGEDRGLTGVFESYLRPVFDSAGEVTAIVVYARDITKRKKTEDVLRESERNLEKAQEIAHLGHWKLDPRSGKIDGSDELFRLFDLTPEEATLDAFAERVHPDDREFDLGMIKRGIDHGEPWDIEHRLLLTDGTEKIVHAKGEAVADENGETLYLVGTVQDITERKEAEQQIHENQSQLKSLASELVLAEERERSRIAVHLHDDICQNLAYSKMKLQMVNAALDDQSQLTEVTDVTNSLTQIMQDVRTLTFELSSPILTEFGLKAALSQWLEEQIEQKHDIATDFTDDGQLKPLKEDVKALLFRSVRELLTNVVKHSQAKRVEVSMSRVDDQILIGLEDNGIGFSPDKVVVGTATGGFGLFSIRERLSQLGGSLEIDSSPGQGCRSVLRAPLEQP
ncbi:MAG: PAS domain S-box protein [Planctomycetes bacterium]|nr:PAS domain S-box protein [Planctomycetota bacterium]